MISIVIAIRSEWAKKILNGEKTIELRKSMPSELPCEVYIYITKGGDKLHRDHEKFFLRKEQEYPYRDPECAYNGKVWAKFTLNKVEKLDIPYPAYFHEVADKYKHIVEGSLVSLHEMHRYFGTKTGYAWHISNLEIGNVHPWLFFYGLKRAPQSWAYSKEGKR